MKLPASGLTHIPFINYFILFFVFNVFVWSNCSNGSEKHENAGLLVKDIMFIVLSQVNKFHMQQATEFQQHFENQLTLLAKNERPALFFIHKNFSHVDGAWTVFPLIEHIVKGHTDESIKWVLICEEDTRVNISLLVIKLQQYNATENWFLGRELRDQETTIIHHFAFADNPSQFAYPDFRAGFVISMALVKHLHHRLQTSRLKTDFSIDPKHELALFVWDGGQGTLLTHLHEFCSAEASDDPRCITTQHGKFPTCVAPIEKADLYVAVKTCQRFHNTRIPVVKATWGKDAAQVIEYFSEVADNTIPTIDLGVPNTERGHCGKTMAILKRIVTTPELVTNKWILIADDDTIINLSRLRALLACYSHQHPIVLGERYGYGVARGSGYDYITGGGGMVFSLPAVKLLADNCRCHTDDSPDDMTLGMCLKSLAVPLTHSRFFHQARPEDYSKDFLVNQLPISFHKHWNNDPYKVYAELTTPSEQETAREQQENPHRSSQHSRREDL